MTKNDLRKIVFESIDDMWSKIDKIDMAAYHADELTEKIWENVFRKMKLTKDSVLSSDSSNSYNDAGYEKHVDFIIMALSKNGYTNVSRSSAVLLWYEYSYGATNRCLGFPMDDDGNYDLDGVFECIKPYIYTKIFV